MEGPGGPSCAAREQVVTQTLSCPFFAFGCLVLMLKAGGIAWQENKNQSVMGMAGLAAAAMASVGAVFSFPTWQILNSHAAKASNGILCPLGQSAGGSKVLLHFREGSMC